MLKKAIRQAYGEKLIEIGKSNKDVVVLEADIGNSSKSILFGNEYPERYFNVGIAETNMVGMAAGMATAGKIPFVNAFAVFMSLRAGDAVRSLVGYMNLNVKLAGTYAGVSAAYDGATHHALEDIAFMRSIPNMTVISVSDAVETAKAMEAAVEYEGPVYLRLSRAEVPVIFDSESYDFRIGKAVQMTEGDDVTIFSTGCTLSRALEASEKLKEKGIGARVVNIHTIKPIDAEFVTKCAGETGAVVTVEEHSIYGGLGSAVSEVLAKNAPCPIEMAGFNDCFTESGPYEGLLDKYGLSADEIVNKVNEVINRK